MSLVPVNLVAGATSYSTLPTIRKFRSLTPKRRVASWTFHIKLNSLLNRKLLNIKRSRFTTYKLVVWMVFLTPFPCSNFYSRIKEVTWRSKNECSGIKIESEMYDCCIDAKRVRIKRTYMQYAKRCSVLNLQTKCVETLRRIDMKL